ncbi:SDR family NAD(P)-dependent oxidoreductase [Nocardioides marmoriginsengisoli]|uniref:SDR family NAD(P)-dependent oxidoreductase n=1 Tax=Nocardioides marmoriginsengisoli TaxID=661483 RepID=A0A3N0CEU9_9ACTN|nr:SDR family NAD(P)-dependent oxidoreductase [Nocardioides marmoriginsengisoli]RNL61984.1 SDR family NAD(P)-dependent oxidoreductase [Nocardioides marmoriginsengisoli]
MSFTPADLPDLTGKVAVVTGANSGIGVHTARELSRHGAKVVLAVRDTAAGDKAATSMPGDTVVEQLDLASQASVREFAERWDGPLDLLVNNAGVMRPPKYRETEDGHELMFGTNHLGHFALTGRLLPALLAAPAPRVVTVASIAHLGGSARVIEGNPEEGYEPEKSYCQSKLANVLFARELHQRATAAGSRLVSTGAHPGVSATGLVSDPNGMGANPLVRWVTPFLLPVILQSAAAGANPSLYAATLGEPGSYTGPQRMGESRGPIGPAKLNRHALDEDLAAKLWELSEQKTGVTFAL